MNAAVHTSAHADEPDMFGGLEVGADPDLHAAVLVLKGELISDAEVRTQLVGADAHPSPVLRIEFRPLSGLQRIVHAEWIYTEAKRKQAEAIAANLKKGARVAVTTPTNGMRTIFPQVLDVALIPPSTRTVT